MAGDVRCTQHLPTDAAGHLALMSDHVGAQSVFGGKSRGTGLHTHTTRGQRSEENSNKMNDNDGNLEVHSEDSYRYLTFERSF